MELAALHDLRRAPGAGAHRADQRQDGFPPAALERAADLLSAHVHQFLGADREQLLEPILGLGLAVDGREQR